MEWWIWVVLAVALLVVLAGTAVWVQARRRSGGVVAVGRERPGRKRGPR